MSNLLKKGSTITKSERVIDYNEKIKEKLQAVIDAESAAGDQSSDGFVNGLTGPGRGFFPDFFIFREFFADGIASAGFLCYIDCAK